MSAGPHAWAPEILQQHRSERIGRRLYTYIEHRLPTAELECQPVAIRHSGLRLQTSTAEQPEPRPWPRGSQFIGQTVEYQPHRRLQGETRPRHLGRARHATRIHNRSAVQIE